MFLFLISCSDKRIAVNGYHLITTLNTNNYLLLVVIVEIVLITRVKQFLLNTMGFKWKDDHTPLILSLMEDCQCLWNTKVPEYKTKVCIICFYFTMKIFSCLRFV
jgi:hypothetical protein